MSDVYVSYSVCNPSIATYLVAGGGCVCVWLVKSQQGYTALIRAAKHGRAECVRLLLVAGADKDAMTNVRFICHSVSSTIVFTNIYRFHHGLFLIFVVNLIACLFIEFVISLFGLWNAYISVLKNDIILVIRQSSFSAQFIALLQCNSCAAGPC